MPGEIKLLETQIQATAEDKDQSLLELSVDFASLRSQCQADWLAAVPSELRPGKKDKKSRPRATTPVGETLSGRVKTYIDERGFGFITPDGGEKDIFFHITKVIDIQNPQEGLHVEFEAVEGRKGLEAVNVRLLQ